MKINKHIIFELRKKEMSLLQDDSLNPWKDVVLVFTGRSTSSSSPAVLFPVVGSADQLEKYKDLVPCKKKKRNPTSFFHASSEVS